jgi:hypothetical protein
MIGMGDTFGELGSASHGFLWVFKIISPIQSQQTDLMPLCCITFYNRPELFWSLGYSAKLNSDLENN